MRLLIPFIFLFVFNTLNAAIVEHGNDYNYKYNDRLKLNETSLEKVIKYFGKPSERYDINTSAAQYVVLRFYMADIKLFTGKARLTYMQFRNGVLNAYVYGSNYNRDHTKFDYKKAKHIKLGQSIEEISSYIGEPTGKSNCPVNTGQFSGFCKKGKYTWLWFYAENQGLLDAKNAQAQAFLVGVDADGKAVEITREKITLK